MISNIKLSSRFWELLEMVFFSLQFLFNSCKSLYLRKKIIATFEDALESAHVNKKPIQPIFVCALLLCCPIRSSNSISALPPQA
jgi:hypothetical protein